MTKSFCKQCGSALTKSGAKFCTTCGATVDVADSVDLSDRETVALPGEQKNQTDFATEVIPAIAPPSLPDKKRDQTDFATEVIPAIAPPSLPDKKRDQTDFATEVIPAIAPPSLPGEQKNQTDFATEVIPAIAPPSLSGEKRDQTDFATEVIPAIAPPAFKTKEIQQVVITERAEERATEVIAAIPTPPVIQRPNKPEEPAPAIKPSVQQEVEKSVGRKKLALAAALGIVALVVVVAASIFFINSRKAPEVQAENRPAENAAPSTPAPPIVQAPNQQASPQPDQPSNQQPNQQPNQKIGQPSGVGAKNQSQSQTRSQPDTSIIDIDIKPPTTRNDVASKPQPEAAAKSAQAPTGMGAAEHQKQGADYLNKRLYQEALREFDFVRKLDPGNKDVYYLIGSAYNGMNQLERALEAYRQCTSGTYVIVAQNAVKNLEKKLKINVR